MEQNRLRNTGLEQHRSAPCQGGLPLPDFSM